MSQNLPDRKSKSPRASATTRRWTRRLAKVAAILLLLFVGVWFTVTSSWFIVMMVQPHLLNRLGGEVSIGRAAYVGDGGFIFHDVRLKSPTMVGVPGEIAHIGRVLLRVDQGAMWKGQIKLNDVRVFSLHVRISEDARLTGQMNFMTLDPKWETGPILPPTVRIDRTVIEVGTHDGDVYTLKGRRNFSGVLNPLDLEEGLFGFELSEFGEELDPTGQHGLQIKGNWNASTFELSGLAEGLMLDDTTYDMCPSMVQLWWDQMELDGQIYGVSFQYKPNNYFDVEFSVENVNMTLPMDTQDLWASFENGRVKSSFGRPRMSVQSGLIRIGKDRVSLENLSGTLGSSVDQHDRAVVPYFLDVVVSSLPPLDWDNKQAWMSSVLNDVPFRMDFRIDDFMFEPDESGHAQIVDLPAPIARVLEKFNMIRWDLSTEFTVHRLAVPDGGGPDQDAPAIQVHGHVYLKNASGAYDKFPYPLENVDAHVEFTQHSIVFHELHANGAGRSGAGDIPVTMTGEITPIGKDASVELHITATNVPLDDQLRSAFNEEQQSAFDAFLHQASFDSLVEKGLLDPNDFQLGGTVDLSLDINRAEGPHQPVVLTGEIDVHSIGVVYQHFPYPIRLNGGRLKLLEDRVVLAGSEDGRGIPISAYGGGQGFVMGDVLIEKQNGHVRTNPHLSIMIEGDSLTEPLYEALPRAPGEHIESLDRENDSGPPRSLAAQWFQGLGLDGQLDYHGDIFRDDTGRFNYDFEVALQGTATPGDQLAEAIGSVGLLWPEGFSLDGVESELKITRDRIELLQFIGHDGDTLVRANGEVDLSASDPVTRLVVNFERLALGPYLVNLAPSESMDRVRELWQRYQPDGHFDLELSYHSPSEETDAMTLVVRPGEIGLSLDGRRVMLNRRDGEIQMADQQVDFKNLRLELMDQAREDGIIRLDGAYNTNPDDSDLQVSGTWQDGRLESPLVPELLRLVGAEAQIEHYRSLSPAGRFDASFSYESPRPDRPRRFEVAIEPHDVFAHVNGLPLRAVLSEGGQITIEPGIINVQGVVGAISGGTFHLDGRVDVSEDTVVNLDIEYEGSLRNPDIEALLPERIRQWAEEVKFTDSEASSLRNGHLHLQETHTSEDGSDWIVNFTGQLVTSEAAISLGADMTEMAGVYDINFNHQPNEWPDVEITAHIDRMLVRNRELKALSAYAYFDQASQSMHVPLIRGDSHGGKISGSARFSVGDQLDYEFQLDLAGVGLEGILKPTAGVDSESGGGRDTTSPELDGDLFGSIHFVGERGKPESRIGRGMIRAIGNRVATIPLTMRIVQVLQSVLPFGGDLDYFDSSFFIEGDYIVFEDILLENSMGDVAPIQVFGSGRLAIETLELDLHFRLRTGPVLLRDLLGGIGDQIIGINVTGSLTEPKASLNFLPGLDNDHDISAASRSSRVVNVGAGVDPKNQ